MYGNHLNEFFSSRAQIKPEYGARAQVFLIVFKRVMFACNVTSTMEQTSTIVALFVQSMTKWDLTHFQVKRFMPFPLSTLRQPPCGCGTKCLLFRCFWGVTTPVVFLTKCSHRPRSGTINQMLFNFPHLLLWLLLPFKMMTLTWKVMPHVYVN